MGKRHNSKFPAAKIKKIIQQNQDIGKLCNTIPPVLQKSLEIFLDDIVGRLNTIIPEYDLNKLTLPALKRALDDSPYQFMKDSLKEIEDLEKGKKRPRRKANDDDDNYEVKKVAKKGVSNEDNDD